MVNQSLAPAAGLRVAIIGSIGCLNGEQVCC